MRVMPASPGTAIAAVACHEGFGASRSTTQIPPAVTAAGVRAFAPGEGTGDTGLVLSLELRFLPPDEWFGRVSRELVFSTFYDTGRVKFKDTPLPVSPGDDPVANTTTLSGWGLGAVWDRPREFALRAYLAWPSSGVAVNDTVVKKPRVYFTANKVF